MFTRCVLSIRYSFRVLCVRRGVCVWAMLHWVDLYIYVQVYINILGYVHGLNMWGGSGGYCMLRCSVDGREARWGEVRWGEGVGPDIQIKDSKERKSNSLKWTRLTHPPDYNRGCDCSNNRIANGSTEPGKIPGRTTMTNIVRATHTHSLTHSLTHLTSPHQARLSSHPITHSLTRALPFLALVHTLRLSLWEFADTCVPWWWGWRSSCPWHMHALHDCSIFPI